MVERLALNIFDTDRLSPMMAHSLLSDKLNVQKTGVVRMDPKKGDEVGVVFLCDLLTAAKVCQILRNQDKEAGDSPTRVYINRGKGWVKLPSDALLVLPQGSGTGITLNPLVFHSVKDSIEALPLAPTVLKL